MPKVAVSCFEWTVFDGLVKVLSAEKIATTVNANCRWPIYKAVYKGKEIALYMTDMGAAGAAAQLEDMYALGVEKVIVFGSCGVLDENIKDCAIIIPDKAVRDEGLSYHYLPPSDEMTVNPKYIPEFTALLDEIKCKYIVGKTWTTDAMYRETKAKVKRRKAQGCVCVEMECAALAAVAQFREKELFQFVYAADSLGGEQWDRRSLGESYFLEEKGRLGELALELAVRVM
jgi:uridine phosphorylase